MKGQISDYYILVVNQYEITGTVVDKQGNPLEGATVMFFSSPVHCNTESDWEFASTSFQCRPTDDDMCVPAAFISGDTLFYIDSTYEGLPVWHKYVSQIWTFQACYRT